MERQKALWDADHMITVLMTHTQPSHLAGKWEKLPSDALVIKRGDWPSSGVSYLNTEKAI